ncbi:MAG: TRAP transporter large permease subunit [Rhodospirillaceae bacterium]|nr:TRAP transporter large permease subunit [Rhodospirillaceae bacterium]
MTETYAIIIFLAALFFLLGSGVWVGASLLFTAVVGVFLFTSRPIGDSMATIVWSGQSSWTLTALPLFIWMGEILYRTRLSETLFRGLAPLLRPLPGGLLHVNIGASAIFAAISGSSAATVATVGKMSIPELRKRQFPERKIIGTLAGAGTLGLLIPPSISMIIYGVTVNESIARLFMAATLPGLCLAVCFMAYVAVWGLLNRGVGTRETADDAVNVWRALLDLVPVLTLIAAVIGSIYTGVATATEAAALGVLGSLVLSAAQRSLTLSSFRESVLGSVRTTAMIMFILMGSTFLSLAMGFTGIPRALAEGIGAWNLSPLALIAMLTVFYILLGCFLDGISSIVLTMAVIEPLVRAAGFDMLWFGVYLMIVVEMAQITPPIGFNLFVLQGMTGRDIGFIAASAFPMFLIMCAFIVLLVLFPGMATWLPGALN